MDWFFEVSGQREGPVSTSNLLELYGQRKLQGSTLVWREGFGDAWKPLSDSGLELPAIPTPPPLPSLNSASPANVVSSTRKLSGFDAEQFLSSKITEGIVGNNFDFYKKKWTKILAKSSAGPDGALSRFSWNWAAFFFNVGWLFYRKMFAAGSLIGAAYLGFSLLLPEEKVGKAFRVAPFLISIICGIVGNSLYLKRVAEIYCKINLKPADDKTPALPRKIIGTSFLYGIASLVIMAVIYGAVEFALEATGSEEIACSSQQTVNLVKEIVSEQMQKAGLGMIVDLTHSDITVDAIRTRESKPKMNNCSAEINFRLKANELLRNGAGGTKDPAQLAAAEKQMADSLKQTVTYTSEYTDKGDQIYVTVKGLNFNR